MLLPLLCSTLANDVIGRLKHLETIILCGQQMNTVDSARCLLQLGKMLPHLEVSSHGEADTDDDEDTDEDSEEDSEEEGKAGVFVSCAWCTTHLDAAQPTECLASSTCRRE